MWNVRLDRRLLWVFLFLLWSFGYFYNGGGGNQVARYNQTRAIVDAHHLYVNGIAYPSDDQILIDGRWYSSKAPGTSLLGVPPYAVFSTLGRLIAPKHPVVANGVAHLTILVTVGIPSALAGVALYAWLVAVGVGTGAAFLGTASVFLGTHFFPYATMFFGHSLAGALAFLSFYLLWKVRQDHAQGVSSGWKVLYAGLLVSAAVLTEYPLAMLAGLLTLYLLSVRPNRAELIQWAAGAAVGIGVLLLYNQLAFGHPFSVSYLNYASSSHNTFPVHSQGVGGVTAPKWSILKEIIWGDARGIVWFAPIVVWWLPAVFYSFWKRRDLWRETLLVLLGGIFFLAFNAGYGDSIRYWGGANSAGPRHLVPMMPFLGLVIGLMLAAWPRLLGVCVLGSSVAALVVTAVMPQVPMLYGKPFSEFLIPYFLNGRLAVHRGGLVSAALVTQDSVVYNLGKWMGLPGSWSLLPLFLGMALLLAGFVWHERAQGRITLRAAAPGLVAFAGLASLLVFGPLVYQAPRQLPLEGPGMLGAFYTERGCKGPLLGLARFDRLSLRFDQGLDGPLRPYPGHFCGIFRSTLTVKSSGMVTFQLRGGKGRLEVDGNVWFEPDKSSSVQRASQALSAGDHTLVLQVEMPVTTNRLGFAWMPPDGKSWLDVPLDHFVVTPEMVRLAKADRL